MLDPRDASAADTRDALVKARTLIDQGGYHQAEVICRKVLETNPGLPDAIYLMGILATRSHFYDDGEALFRQAIASRGHPIFYRDLSRCLVAAGREEDALVALGEGLERVPNNVDLLAFRGQLLSIFGRKDEAIASMNRVLELAPKKAPHFSIARLTKYDSADHPHLKLMEELLLRPDIDVDQRAQLRFGAAHAYDQLGDYEKGFALLAAGNRHKHETVAFDIEEEERNMRTIVSSFPPELFETMGTVGIQDETPVLIVGMPRSGTTLVEQILYSHPSVKAVGEVMDLPLVTSRIILRALGDGGRLPQQVGEVPAATWVEAANSYLEALVRRGGEGERIVDKQLFNDTMLGIFHLMFPNGRVIHCLRDPMDNCLSCFRANFESDRGYVYDQTTLGRTYRLHEELMKYWKEALPERMIHTVQYEEMVDDVEAGARDLIEFMGLPWDDACLKFHETERAVRTLSQGQVRQPIYRSSIGRWRNYEPYLDELKAALALPVDLRSAQPETNDG